MDAVGRDYRLYLSIGGPRNGIMIGKDVLRILGEPSYVCLLKGKDKKTIAIAPCAEEDPLSFKIPAGLMENPNRKFRIYSSQFTQELLTANGLEPLKTHGVMGAYVAEMNAVVFPLKVL